MAEKEDKEKDKIGSNRREFLKSLGIATVPLTGLPNRKKMSRASSDEGMDVKRKILVDNQSVRIARVEVNDVFHLFKEFKKGQRKGRIDHVKLGSKNGNPRREGQSNKRKDNNEPNPASSKSWQNDFTLMDFNPRPHLQLASYDYSTLVRRHESFSKTIGSCAYYSDYNHFYAGDAIELTQSIDTLSKNTLAGLIGYFLGGGIGTVISIIAGTVLSLYTDKDFTVGAKDFDTPITNTPMYSNIE